MTVSYSSVRDRSAARGAVGACVCEGGLMMMRRRRRVWDPDVDARNQKITQIKRQDSQNISDQCATYQSPSKT